MIARATFSDVPGMGSGMVFFDRAAALRLVLQLVAAVHFVLGISRSPTAWNGIDITALDSHPQ